MPAFAALPTLVPQCALQATTQAPPLSCFLELGVNVSNWIFGITGSLALLFFIYGGFLFLTSGGSEQQVTKGKTILTQAVIGIIIIFGAFVAVKFIVSALGASKYFKPEFETQQPTTSEQNPAATKANAYQCNCSYEKFDFQTKTFTTASDPIKQYLVSEDCAKNCDSLCKSTTIPNINPPGQYSGGECQTLK
ncbi:MAG: pilin [bacterium]